MLGIIYRVITVVIVVPFVLCVFLEELSKK